MKIYFSLMICTLLTANCFAQHNKFAGIWSNTRYQRITGYVDKLQISKNPRYIKIDEAGRCTVMNDPDHMIDLGLPVSKNRNGNEEELTYKGRLTYVITTNDSIEQFISLEISNNGFHVLLTRVHE